MADWMDFGKPGSVMSWGTLIAIQSLMLVLCYLRTFYVSPPLTHLNPTHTHTSALNQGFTQPSEIQRQCLSAAIRDRLDIIGAAQTGSGKTLVRSPCMV